MTKPIQQRKLHDYEYDLIRLVACGYTNAQLAVETDVAVETVRSRLHVIHQLIGFASGGDNAMARVRMAIWAYDHGLVKPAGLKLTATPAEVLPQERIPAELAAPMIRLSIAILSDEPRGELKRWARRVMEAARLTMPKAMGRPTADTQEAEAA